MPRPFSIKVFLPAGEPDGLRIIEKSNWSGVGIAFPRSTFAEVRKRPEMERAGVYVLIGPSESGDLDTVYIGHADPVGIRLSQHYAKKDFWTWAVFFASKDGTLNKADVQHMESRLIALAHEAKRAQLDNQNSPSQPSLTEAEQADAESFLEDMLSIFPLVGLRAFIKAEEREDGREILLLSGKGVTARGFESADGLVVKAGSHAVNEETKSIHRYMSTLRAKLLDQGVLVPDGNALRFTQDYPFSSPSTAAGVIFGRPASGPNEWKDESGRSLRELREMEGRA